MKDKARKSIGFEESESKTSLYSYLQDNIKNIDKLISQISRIAVLDKFKPVKGQSAITNNGLACVDQLLGVYDEKSLNDILESMLQDRMKREGRVKERIDKLKFEIRTIEVK